MERGELAAAFEAAQAYAQEHPATALQFAVVVIVLVALYNISRRR